MMSEKEEKFKKVRGLVESNKVYIPTVAFHFREKGPYNGHNHMIDALRYCAITPPKRITLVARVILWIKKVYNNLIPLL